GARPKRSPAQARREAGTGGAEDIEPVGEALNADEVGLAIAVEVPGPDARVAELRPRTPQGGREMVAAGDGHRPPACRRVVARDIIGAVAGEVGGQDRGPADGLRPCSP